MSVSLQSPQLVFRRQVSSKSGGAWADRPPDRLFKWTRALPLCSHNEVAAAPSALLERGLTLC